METSWRRLRKPDERKSSSINQIACGGSGICPRHHAAVSCCFAMSCGWVFGTISATASSMRRESFSSIPCSAPGPTVTRLTRRCGGKGWLPTARSVRQRRRPPAPVGVLRCRPSGSERHTCRRLSERLMDNDEAVVLLEAELAPFREESYDQLLSRMSAEGLAFERVAPSGAKYQVDIQVFWDSTDATATSGFGLHRRRGMASVHTALS